MTTTSNRPRNLGAGILVGLALASAGIVPGAHAADAGPGNGNSRPNILLLTADDMNHDAIGAFGCPVAGTTPNLDRLASEGIRFERAHVAVAVCQPSRSALLTGRYPHRSGGEGFFHLRQPGIPILPGILRDHGYRVGIMGKVRHSTPYATFTWDRTGGDMQDTHMADLGYGRNPALYASFVTDFVRSATAEGRPFFAMINSHDPHRPFYGNDQAEFYQGASPAAAPSRIFLPREVKVPGFLPDLPGVRQEIAEYYSSVRRCDDTMGAVLAALGEAGVADNTIVVFLSDNGMAFPFSKANCYLHSTRTPWMMRWPGRIQPGTVEREQFISGIDLLPTLLAAVGIPEPDGVDGRSFLPILSGEQQDGRDLVFTQFEQNSKNRNFPMRSVQSGRYGYIFNPWSDGKRVFTAEAQRGRAWQALQAATTTDPEVQARVSLFEHRVVEEFYDFQNDPDALVNLASDPACAAERERLQAALEEHMVKTQDPALVAFRNRNDPAALAAYMALTRDAIGGE